MSPSLFTGKPALRETTPAVITPALTAVFVSAAPMRGGRCFGNVDRAVATRGGARVHGSALLLANGNAARNVAPPAPAPLSS